MSMPASTTYNESIVQNPDFADANDRRLLACIADSQDIQALEQLYKSYTPRLSQFLQRLTSDPQNIEEVCNDVMMAVWKQAKNFNGKSKVSTWIFSIAYRICIKVLRKSSWRPEVGGEIYEKLSTTRIDETATNDDNKDIIALALKELSPKHRMVVELSYFLDCSYEEIAEISNCPLNTVKTRMFYARRQLRQIVNKIS